MVAVFFVAVIGFGLAYQAKPSYKIEIGSRTDQPYVSGFTSKEPDENHRGKGWDGFDYRWTNYESKIDLPGLGSQPLTVTLRISPAANPAPTLKVFVNEKNQVPPEYLQIQPREEFFVLSFPVPAKWFPDGNLHLKLQTDVWRPSEVVPGSKDSRKLGMLVDWVKVEPDLSNSGLVRPPDDIFIPLVICSLLVVLIFFSLGLPPLYALLASGGVIAGSSVWLVFDRLNLTELVSKDFVRSLFFSWVVVYITAELGSRIFKALGIIVTRREAGWLAGIFLLQFVVLWGVMSHPMFGSSDLGLNIHRLQDVHNGTFIFPQELPNGRLAPYPPAYYIALQLLFGFTDGGTEGVGTLIKVASALLQATEIYFVFYLASLLRHNPIRVTSSKVTGREFLEREWEVGTNWAGISAAALYTVCKYPYYIFSQGNHTNLFGSWAFLLFICITAGTLSYLQKVASTKVSSSTAPVAQPSNLTEMASLNPTRPNSAFPVALLDPPVPPPTHEHYEEDIEIKPSLSQRYFGRLLPIWRSKIWPVLAVTLRYLLPLAALVLVFTAHYGTFLFANAFMLAFMGLLALFGGRAGRRDALYLICCHLSALVISFLLYYNQVIKYMSSPTSGDKPELKPPMDLIGEFVSWFWRDLVFQFGLIVVIVAVAGAVMRLSGPGWKNIFHKISPVGAALLALCLTVFAFAGLQFLFGLETRYQLYLLPLVALAGGTFLGRIWRSGWAGVVLVSALFLFQFLEVLAFWLDRIGYYFEF
jgi:uncharacterized membrane protein YhaH (DUF805 family)